MSKIKVRKDIAEQMTSKLKTLKKGLESANSVKKVTNFDDTSKLPANENIFTHGDFDGNRKFVELEKQTIPNGIYECLRYGYYLEPKGYEPQKCKTGVRNPRVSAHYELYKIQDGNYYQNFNDELEKSNPYPRQEGGKFGCKPDLTVKNILTKAAKKKGIDLSKLDVVNPKDFCQYVDDLYNGKEPNFDIIRLPDINDGLCKQLGIESHCYMTKEKFKHGGPQRKGSYNNPQDLRIEEYKRVPHIIKNTKVLYWDKVSKNFLIPFVDRHNPEKINKICFYKDLSGNYAVTVGKVDVRNITNASKKVLVKVGVGVAPTIHKSFQFSEKKYPVRYLPASTTFKGKNLDNSNIAHCDNLSSKNVSKSLTYSGHKLQGRTRLYGMDISIENKKGSYRSGVDKDGHKWKTLMHYDYGYIRGTVGTDKDHLDCYVGPDKEAQKVYVIHQNDPVTHKYDEDKCMLCFSSAADAKAAYMKQYDRPGFYGSMTTMTIEQFKSFIFSHKGKMVHKSFDINITDITENNKQQKLEQVNKALNAIADNRPFMIKHIPADSSTNYGNLLVRITDFDRSKIEKAVHKIALSLDADISGASKGEAFVYKSQEEIVDKFFKEFTNRTRAVYNFVISYFDLPDIRIVSKAGELRHKGKILYNPETGLPIKESEWKKFIVELEKFLNRNYTGIGEKIVLSAESLGIILDRLSKTNSLDAIRKMSVADLKAKRYDVDWISESVKTMKDKFGDVISRERQARIQIAIDSAAQRVTKVKDDMRNNIQQIIIDGIRDKQSKSVVAQNLFDKCASLNRDMQRIADSEVQMASNSSYCKEEVYNSKPDEKVYFKRFEMIDDNTCKKCKKLNGTIVLWSDVPLPDEHIKDPIAKYAIWEGKNDGDCPIGIVHPYCRGSWIRYYPDV